MSALEGFALLSALAGIAGILVHFSLRIRAPVLKAVACSILLAPGLLLMALALGFVGEVRPSEKALAPAAAVFWLAMCVLAIVFARTGAQRLSRPKQLFALLAIPLLTASAALAWRAAEREHSRALSMERSRKQLQREWRRAEAALRKCATELSAELGRQDALASIARGDRRLYGTYAVFQESSFFEVPGVDSQQPTGGLYPVPDTISGRAGDDNRLWLFAVTKSPKGEIWTDPWHSVESAMGRPPPSAKACEAQTRAYVAAYNDEVLRSGPARIPAESANALSHPYIRASLSTEKARICGRADQALRGEAMQVQDRMSELTQKRANSSLALELAGLRKFEKDLPHEFKIPKCSGNPEYEVDNARADVEAFAEWLEAQEPAPGHT